MHRQGDVGGGVVSVQKQVDGGFGHVCDRLYDGGADVPSGGKIKDAVIADDLHILWDPDPPANQEFADPDSQAFYGTYSTDIGLVMAALLLAMLPILIHYVFLQRYIVEGVTSGAVKG